MTSLSLDLTVSDLVTMVVNILTELSDEPLSAAKLLYMVYVCPNGTDSHRGRVTKDGEGLAKIYPVTVFTE